MARSVHQILGLLGTKDPAAVRVYPLPTDDSGDGGAPVTATALATAALERATAWASVWGADFGRLTASVTAAEKDALVAAGAHEHATR